jgi:tyrosinase
MTTATSAPLRFSVPVPPSEFARADLEFYGVDHSGPSFEARIFLNNPQADENTRPDVSEGYAGSFHIFGHGGCFGEEGHCEVPQGPRRYGDVRPQHQLTPVDKRVVVTDALRAALQASPGPQLTVTVLPVVHDAEDYLDEDLLKDPLKIESVRLLTYR